MRGDLWVIDCIGGKEGGWCAASDGLYADMGRGSSMRRSSEGLRCGGVAILAGGEGRCILISSSRDLLSSAMGFLAAPGFGSSSHSRSRFGAVLPGLSSRSRAAASAAVCADDGGGAPLAMLGVAALGLCSNGVLGGPK